MRGIRYPLVEPAEEQPVSLEEVEEQGARDALIAVEKTVVLDDEIEEVGSLLLCRRIELLPLK